MVLCQLGLQFVGDEKAALRETRRVLVPGGRLLVSVPPPNASFDVLDEALARHVGDQAAGFVRMVFSLSVVGGWQPWSDDAGMGYEQGMNVAKTPHVTAHAAVIRHRRTYRSSLATDRE